MLAFMPADEVEQLLEGCVYVVRKCRVAFAEYIGMCEQRCPLAQPGSEHLLVNRLSAQTRNQSTRR